jgi:hypothetical protein
MNENRREFFRVFFGCSIEGKVLTETGETWPIEIEDISVKGLRFVSSTDIQPDRKLDYQFDILDSSFLLEGSIIRKAIKNDQFEYGVTFSLDQNMASRLFQQLNYYQIRQRRGYLVD